MAELMTHQPEASMDHGLLVWIYYYGLVFLRAQDALEGTLPTKGILP
jgi:hypothetical protein